MHLNAELGNGTVNLGRIDDICDKLHGCVKSPLSHAFYTNAADNGDPRKTFVLCWDEKKQSHTLHCQYTLDDGLCRFMHTGWAKQRGHDMRSLRLTVHTFKTPEAIYMILAHFNVILL